MILIIKMSNPILNNQMCCIKCNHSQFSLNENTSAIIQSNCLNCGFLYELRSIEKYVKVPTYISDPEASCIPIRKPVFIKRMIKTRVVTNMWVPIETSENLSTNF